MRADSRPGLGRVLAIAAALALPTAAAPAAAAPPGGIAPGARSELVHPGAGHEIHVSALSLAALPDGTPLAGFVRSGPEGRHVWVSRFEDGKPVPARVDPEGLPPDSAHQPPGLAVAANGDVLASWSSAKTKPPGVLFASDLRVSRSRDGGRRFEAALRVNEDRPISHSFEAISAAPDGGALVAWIDSREGRDRPATWLARVELGADGANGAGRGSEPQVRDVRRLAGDTCVCCRVAAASGPAGRVAFAWRQVFPGNVRDPVLALSRDGGRSVAPPVRVAEDGWSLEACPHRGASIAFDATGQVHAAWYSEGRDAQPSVRYARASSGTGDVAPQFGAPVLLEGPPGTVPDHVVLAVSPDGAVLVAWEALTAVRRQVVVRVSLDGGQRFGPPLVVSRAMKAMDPALVARADGSFLAAWHEERFPSLVSVVQELRVSRGEPRP